MVVMDATDEGEPKKNKTIKEEQKINVMKQLGRGTGPETSTIATGNVVSR